MKLNDLLKLTTLVAVMGLQTSCIGGMPLKPAYAVLKCEAKVLEPYIDNLADVVVTQIDAKQVDVGQLLLSLGVPLLEIEDVKADLKKCKPPVEVVSVEQVDSKDAGAPNQ